jgi:hypothetical protein
MESPYIGEKQTNAFRKFFKNLPHGKDITLVVLKGHLLLEEQVRAIVDERLVTPSALLDSRFDCHQAICLAEALCPKDVDPSVWKAAKKLNRIRNDVAHNLSPKGLNDRLMDFIDAYPPWIRRGGRYGAGKIREKSIEPVRLAVHSYRQTNN